MYVLYGYTLISYNQFKKMFLLYNIIISYYLLFVCVQS